MASTAIKGYAMHNRPDRNGIAKVWLISTSLNNQKFAWLAIRVDSGNQRYDEAIDRSLLKNSDYFTYPNSIP